MESAERCEQLERLLRGSLTGETGDSEMYSDTPASPETDPTVPLPQVRGADEACRGLSTFSCARIPRQPAAYDVQQVLALHRRFVEEGESRRADECAMQVDSPSPNREDASFTVKAVLKVSGKIHTPVNTLIICQRT